MLALKKMKDYTQNTMENKYAKMGLVIMASGLGKRFGGNKLLEPLGEKPIIQWVLDATEGIFEKRVVVTRSDAIKTMCDSMAAPCILHELPNRNDTVRLGLSWLEKDVEYCFFTPADQPLISKASIQRLTEAGKKHPEKIIRACYADTIGTPTGFPKKYFQELKNLPEHKGGNWIAAKYADVVNKVEVCHGYELLDIDTVSDLEKIKAVLHAINDTTKTKEE